MLKEDFDALVPASGGVSRRTFVRGALGTGFAASVLPAMALTAIRTDSIGLETGEVMIPVGDFGMPAYRAAPQGRLIAEVVARVPDEQVLRDLDASLAWARAQGADTSRSGITGFCWGGRITWLHAAHNPQLKAGVAWYGRLVGEASPLQPRHPVDIAGALQAPVLGLYGAKDTGIPLQTVDRMKAALATGSAAAKKSAIVIHPDVPHAFHADYRPSFRKDAAEDGWRRCLDWFRTQGVA